MCFHWNLYFQKGFKCDDCGIFKKMEKQIKKHHSAHKKGFHFCGVCSKMFEDINHLEEHQDICVIGGKCYKCLEKSEDGMVCGYVYSAKGSLHAHVNDKHGKPLAELEYKRKKIGTSPGRPWRLAT